MVNSSSTSLFRQAQHIALQRLNGNLEI